MTGAVPVGGLSRGGPLVFLALVLNQDAVAQDVRLEYRADMLACVALNQTVSSEIETAHGAGVRSETVTWEGDLVYSARPDSAAGVSVVAWFDRLRVWRQLPEGRLEPSTDGMIGGHYRGTLSRDGGWRGTAAPFVPDAVATVADLGTALDELLPPAPGLLPAVDEEVTAEGGFRLLRLPDSTAAGHSMLRWSVSRTDTSEVAVTWGDGQTSVGTSVESESGSLLWSLDDGPLAWERSIETVVSFPPSAVSPRPVRTTVRQQRRFRHLGTLPPERCPTP